MKVIDVALPTIALVLLGLHALRHGDWGLASTWCAMAGMVAVSRQRWVWLVVVAALVWGGFLWADATVNFLRFRMAAQSPWLRLSAIMGGIILFNALALASLFRSRCRIGFSAGSTYGAARAAMFLLTVAGLAVARHKVAFPILLADRFAPGWGALEIFLLGLYAQWVGGLMLVPKGHATVRPKIWAAFSLVFFAQLVLGLLGVERMLMTGTLHLPVPALILAGPVFRGDGFFMLVLFGVTLLLVGPAWCSHLCYIGAWDDALSRRGKLNIGSGRIRRLAILGRGTTLLVCVGLAAGLRFWGASGTTAVVLASLFGAVGVALMVTVSRRSGVMVHCTTYCPMGLVANWLGKLSPWRMRISDDCTGCGACVARCRYAALDAEQVSTGRPGLSCTLCGDCVSACVHHHISYAFPGLTADVARQGFIVFVVSLHALFLGVARI